MKKVLVAGLILAVSIAAVWIYFFKYFEIIDDHNLGVKIIEPGGCFSDGKNISEIYNNDSVVVVRQSIVTSTPCHSLSAEFQRTGNKINVYLIPSQKASACVECIGVVTGEVNIDLTPGNYSISLFSKTDGKTELLNEKNVVIE